MRIGRAILTGMLLLGGRITRIEALLDQYVNAFNLQSLLLKALLKDVKIALKIALHAGGFGSDSRNHSVNSRFGVDFQSSQILRP